MSGYVRGRTLDANQLVHLVGFGDYQLSHIDQVPDPASGGKWQRLQKMHRSRHNSVSSETQMDVVSEMFVESTLSCIYSNYSKYGGANMKLQTHETSEVSVGLYA